MKNTLTKTILEQVDVDSLQPDFSLLKSISKAQAAKTRALIFDKDKTSLAILTTNEKPDLLKILLDNLTNKKIKYQLYYTDPDSFEHSLLWYDQMELQDSLAAKDKESKAQASGQSAEKLLQDLYTKRNDMDDGKFVTEIIKLTYQAGASDLHFQPELEGIVMRMRKDGVMKQLLKFTHAEFKKYLLKIKFMAGAKMNVDYMPQDGRFDFMAG